MAASVKAIKSSNIHRLPPLPTIRDLIRLYKLRALKQFSQNFLMEERLTDKIVKSAGKIENGHVLEVGPGPGSITRSIIKSNPKHLVVVEKDRRFVPTLELLAEATKGITHMDIVRDDILKYRCEYAFPDCQPVDWSDKPANVHVIGNLPFAISTRLLINWLKDISLKRGAWHYGRASLTLTFQLEVAERINAPFFANQRCRLSLMSQIWTKPELKFIIPGKAFVPKPNVDVGVVTLVPLVTPLTDLPFDLVEKVMRYIFSMRQKYVKRCVENLFPPKIRDEMTVRVFQTADIDHTTRSFELSNEECLRIASVYYEILQEMPEIEKYDYRGPMDLRKDWDDWTAD
jgi:dimethyladenosine transferase 1, mitochondrial